MFGKKKYLVKDFDSIYKSGDLSKLKAVFDKCDINATMGKYGSTAFGFTPANRELFEWLIASGGDINKADYYGVPPLFKQASHSLSSMIVMLEIGADVTLSDKNGRDLLRVVLDGDSLDQVEYVLDLGRFSLGSSGWQMSSLEYVLYQPRLYDELPKKVELLLERGATITDKARKFADNIATTFENKKLDYDATTLQENTIILSKLNEILT